MNSCRWWSLLLVGPCLLLSTTIASGQTEKPTADSDTYDIVVIGGTPGGIAAAVTAARLGHSVVLAEYHPHIGGMSTSGLGKSDIEHRAVIQGFFREFVDRVRAHYVAQAGGDVNSPLVKACQDGYFYEPSVAEKVFHSFLSEQPSLTLLTGHQFEKAETKAGRIVAVTVLDRASQKLRTLRGKIFIDATYEGDVYAAAGAEFRLGRESREEFGEPHAGNIYVDWRSDQTIGGTGAGDKRLPAFTYRLCLTTDPKNSVPLTAPPTDYDRGRYLGYLEDASSDRFPGRNVTSIAFSIATIPGQKTDVNMNPRGLGFVFVEENGGYVEGTWAERERISRKIQNLTLGLLYFLQNDAEVPAAAQARAREHHLCRDEFADIGHFPFQLYVREARRLVGEYTLSERNITEQPGLICEREHADAIAVGEFPIDSFPVQKRQPGDDRVLEGYVCMLRKLTRPYQIPYRIMVPKKVDGLLVPVAASTTHVAYSSIRMEPTWMALGQAAGNAAHLAIEQQVEPRRVPIAPLQELLRRQRAVLDLPAK